MQTLQNHTADENINDDLLIEQTLSGDYDAFEQLVARHSRRVYAIARKFFRGQEIAEDIVQETFSKAYFCLASYRRGASFAHWLAKIAINNCYDELRRRRRRGESLLSDVTDDEAGWLETRLARDSYEMRNNERERERATEITEKLLSKLSPETRLTLVLLHAEEYSVREVAQMMGWSEAKVKIRAFRARNEMRRALERLTLTENRISAAQGVVCHA
jgi:RNA polymerase sigma-70 factor (ECF subfamily)